MTHESFPAGIAPAQPADPHGMTGGFTLLDVRTPGEYAANHIHRSHNVPLHLLVGHARDIGAAASGPIVLVCQSGGRACQAEQVLWEEGISRLHVLDRGVAAWEASGRATGAASAGGRLNRGQRRCKGVFA